MKTKQLVLKPCSECGATGSPSWRKGKNGERLCNACGLFLARTGRNRSEARAIREFKWISASLPSRRTRNLQPLSQQSSSAASESLPVEVSKAPTSVTPEMTMNQELLADIICALVSHTIRTTMLNSSLFSELPQDVLWIIFSFLSPKEITSSSLVCKTWADIFLNKQNYCHEMLWKSLLNSYWDSAAAAQGEDTDLRLVFKNLYDHLFECIKCGTGSAKERSSRSLVVPCSCFLASNEQSTIVPFKTFWHYGSETVSPKTKQPHYFIHQRCLLGSRENESLLGWTLPYASCRRCGDRYRLGESNSRQSAWDHVTALWRNIGIGLLLIIGLVLGTFLMFGNVKKKNSYGIALHDGFWLLSKLVGFVAFLALVLYFDSGSSNTLDLREDVVVAIGTIIIVSVCTALPFIMVTKLLKRYNAGMSRDFPVLDYNVEPQDACEETDLGLRLKYKHD